MKYADCMRRLGLPESATLEEVKRAYRHWVHKAHPDKNAGGEAALKQFIEIGRAYHTLMRAAQSVERGKRVGLCAACHAFSEVVVGPDGRARCERCALPPLGGRLLPMPSLVVVRCASSLLLLAGAVYLLVYAILTGNLMYSTGAFFAGLLSLMALAHTCITVPYCVRKRDWDAVIKSRSGCGQQSKLKGTT